MSRATFFIRQCPTCGRRLQIRVEYLGRNVKCRHCEANFVACDPSIAESCTDPGDALMDRVNRLLESYDATRNRPR
jgi:hypothetical protein